MRETFEEIGLTNFNAKPLQPYVWESAVEKELVFLFVSTHPGPLKCATDEVEEIRIWSRTEIDSQLGSGVFTPNFEHEYIQFLKPQPQLI